MLKSKLICTVYKTVFVLLVLKSSTILTKGSQCNESEEVAYKKSCYKLMPLQSLLKYVAGTSSNCSEATNELCYHYYRAIAQALTSIYLGNMNLFRGNEYEFSYLSSNLDKQALSDVVEKYWTSLGSRQKSVFNILTIYYVLDGHGYIEGEPHVEEMPNVMLHEDLMAAEHDAFCLYGIVFL